MYWEEQNHTASVIYPLNDTELQQLSNGSTADYRQLQSTNYLNELVAEICLGIGAVFMNQMVLILASAGLDEINPASPYAGMKICMNMCITGFPSILIWLVLYSTYQDAWQRALDVQQGSYWCECSGLNSTCDIMSDSGLVPSRNGSGYFTTFLLLVLVLVEAAAQCVLYNNGKDGSLRELGDIMEEGLLENDDPMQNDK